MHPSLLAILAISLTAALTPSLVLMRVLVASSPVRSDAETIIKQPRTARVVTTHSTVTGCKREYFDIWDDSANCSTRHKVLVT